MSDRWLSRQQAVALIRERINGSIGRSGAILKRGEESGEIRVVIDDPTCRTTPHLDLYSADDLIDWLDQQEPSQTKPLASTKGRSGGKEALMRKLFAKRWVGEVPNSIDLPNPHLFQEGDKLLKEHFQTRDLKPFSVSHTVMLRAAGRRPSK